MKAFRLAILYLVAARVIASPTTLLLETDKDIYRVGELGMITLRIEGATIDPPLDQQANFESVPEVIQFASINTDTGFVYRTHWRAPSVGLHTIGPFTLTIDGKELKSKAKKVRVIDNEIRPLEVSFDRIEVVVGSTFHLEIRSNRKKFDKLKLKPNNLVSVIGTTTSSFRSTGIVFSKETAERVYKIKLKAIEPGFLEIDANSFEGTDIPSKFSPVKIEIKAN